MIDPIVWRARALRDDAGVVNSRTELLVNAWQIIQDCDPTQFLDIFFPPVQTLLRYRERLDLSRIFIYWV